MNAHWPVKVLGEVCHVTAGQSPESKHYNEVGDGLPFYQGKKDFGDKFICPPRIWTKDITKEALDGDILMSVRAPVGPINFATSRICIGRGLAGIRASKAIDREFLFYALLSMQEEISGTEGAVFASINKREIEALAVPVPPLHHQRRIVGILDDAFAGLEAMRAHAEKNLQNARALFDSYIDVIFAKKGNEWVQDTIGNCFKLSSGENLTSKAMIKGPFAVFGGNGIAGMHDQFNLSGDNVIIGRVGALCGNVRNVKEKIWLTDNAFRVVDKRYEFDNGFLTFLLNYKDLRRLARQSAQPVISNSSLKEVILDFPKSVKAQREIRATLEDISTEISRLEYFYNQKLDALDELKKSLLHQAFSGNL